MGNKKTYTQSVDSLLDNKLKEQAYLEYKAAKHEVYDLIKKQDAYGVISAILSPKGASLAGLSFMPVPRIVSWLGCCTKSDLDTFLTFQKKLRNVQAKAFINEAAFNMRERRLKVSDILMPTPAYGDVIEYAKNFGYILSIPKKALAIAEEVRRTATLFEIVKTNVNRFCLPIDDGLITTSWVDYTSPSETEYNILQNLCLLQESLPFVSLELNRLLNIAILRRFLSQTEALKKLATVLKNNKLQTFRIDYAVKEIEFLSCPDIKVLRAVNPQQILYHVIQKSKSVLENYPNEGDKEVLVKWLSRGVKEFEESLPDKLKQPTNVPLSIDLSFLNDEEDELTDGMEKSEDTKDQDLPPLIEEIERDDDYTDFFKAVEAGLPKEEALVYLAQNYHKGVYRDLKLHLYRKHQKGEDDAYLQIDELPEELREIFCISNLPDIYTFFALGIITKDQADNLSKLAQDIFQEKGIEKLDELFDVYMQKNQGQITDEMDEAYDAYRCGKETGDYQYLNLNETLLNLGLSPAEIEDLVPSVKELYHYLIANGFDKYEDLITYFDTNSFDLADDFKELAGLIIDDFNGIKYMTVQDLSVKTPCIRTDMPNKTIINQLVIIRDVFVALQDYVEQTPMLKEAKILWKKMVYALYHNRLKQLDELPINKYHPNITPQLKWMSRHFAKKFPNSNVLNDKDKNLAFMANVARMLLRVGSRSTKLASYYEFLFNDSFGSTFKKDEDLCGIKVQPIPLVKPIDNDLSLTELKQVVQGLYEDCTTPKDREINRNDTRCAFAHCSEVDMLSVMGVINQVEYWHLAKAIDNSYAENLLESIGSIEDALNYLDKTNAPFRPYITPHHLTVMQRIKGASALIDSSYQYEHVKNSIIDYKQERPSVTVQELQKIPLEAEGRLLDTLIAMMSDLPEENLLQSRPLKLILNSYYKECTQGIYDLMQQDKETRPDIYERLQRQKIIFGLQEGLKVETINSRLKHYPRLFHLMRQGILRQYENDHHRRSFHLAFFEKEIAPFVSIYKNKDSRLALYLGVQQKSADRTK